jgi:hypothetical protein
MFFMQEQARTTDCYIKPERCELREGGYFYQAKLIVLRNLGWRKKGLSSVEEKAMHACDSE